MKAVSSGLKLPLIPAGPPWGLKMQHTEFKRKNTLYQRNKFKTKTEMPTFKLKCSQLLCLKLQVFPISQSFS